MACGCGSCPCRRRCSTAAGGVTGAVNMLIDVTEARQAAELREQAVRSRRLASSVGDSQSYRALSAMATEYEARAAALEAACPWGEYVAA